VQRPESEANEVERLDAPDRDADRVAARSKAVVVAQRARVMYREALEVIGLSGVDLKETRRCSGCPGALRMLGRRQQYEPLGCIVCCSLLW
jgi:hypothetical protein